MKTLKIQEINLQQGLVIDDINKVVGVYCHHRKTIYLKDYLIIRYYDMPINMQDYDKSFNYDSFSLAGWNIEKETTELI